MKVSFNTNQSRLLTQNNRILSTNKVEKTATSSINSNFRPMVISFGGNKLNQVAIVTAECNGIVANGGVGTVAADLANNQLWSKNPDGTLKLKSITFMPLYNGRLEFKPDRTFAELDPENNKYALEFDNVKTWEKEGKFYFTTQNLAGKTINDDPKKLELEKIASKEIDIGGAKETATVFKVKDKDTYLFATDSTLKMTKPYEVGDMSLYASNGKPLSQADPYASFNKAVVELMPELEKHGVNPKHIILNDPQAAYIPEFIAQKASKGEQFFKDVTSNYIIHNAGAGYQQRSTAKQMFFNIATNEEIEALKNSEIYKSIQQQPPKYRGMLEDQFFKEILKPIIGADNETSALMLALKHAEKGNVAYVNTVSPGYARSISIGNGEATGVKPILADFYKKGKFFGILNGLNSPNMDPTKPIGLDFYKNQDWSSFAAKKNISKENYKEFGNFLTFDPSKDSISSIIDIKQQNAANLFERINYAIDNKIPELVIGLERKDIDVTGKIDTKFIDMIKGTNGSEKQHVNVFVTWGRADDQKGLDVTMNAFYKFMKRTHEELEKVKASVEKLKTEVTNSPEAKETVAKLQAEKTKLKALQKADNSVLIMGGPIKGTYLENDIKELVRNMAQDPVTKGKFTFMSGFAPNAVLSSAGDVPIFPSRFAPCELTDLESMRFGANPIVTGLQGLDDKNFDIRNLNESSKATGYKTLHSAVTEIDSLDASKYTGPRQNALKKYFKAVQDFKTKAEAQAKAVFLSGDASSPKAYSAEQINEQVEKAVKHSYEDYNGVLRKALMKVRDVFVEEDIVEAMHHHMSIDNNTNESMIKNALFLQTGWRNNADLQVPLSTGQLTPIKKSAGEMYENMVETAPKTAWDKILDFSNDTITKIKEFIDSKIAIIHKYNPINQNSEKATFMKENPVNNLIPEEQAKNKSENILEQAKSQVDETIEGGTKTLDKFFNKKTAWIGLGVVALGGLAYYLFKPEKNESKKNNTINSNSTNINTNFKNTNFNNKNYKF